MVSTHTIRVLGRDLQVKSAASAEHVAGVESFVNAALAETEAAVKGGDGQVVVILTLMNIAEAYLAVRDEDEQRRRSQHERIAALIARVDEQLG